MANFTPSGILRIGSVPFDDSYKHVRLFDSKEEQANWFAQRCDTSLERDSYTYIRMRNSVRVPHNAELLYTKNYVMYKNANYGSKWFYAFITGVNYINEHTTELVLELDIMQTWMFDYELEPTFVEREHVIDDIVGRHTNPEPEMPLVYTTNDRYTDPDLADSWVVVQTNAIPVKSDDLFSNGVAAQTKVGGWYNRVFSGCKYYAYQNTADPEGNSALKQLLEDINKSGAAESVANIFMFPKKLTPPVGSDQGVQEDTAAISYTRKVSRPTTLGDGYEPRNKKLLCYPYCFCQVDDNNGHVKQLMYEYWDAYTLSVQSSIDPDATCIVAPQGYMGVGNNVGEALTFPLTARCSWNYSAYQTWAAQNSMSNALTVGTNAAMMLFPAAKGIGAAAKALGVASKYFGSTTKALSNKATRQAARDEAAAATSGYGLMAAQGASGLASFAGEYSRQTKIPDTVKGSASGNTLFANEYMTYNVSQIVLRKEYAQILDSFLDMYGYQVDMLKVPSVRNRPSWNYVKTQNADFHGNVPADDMAQINAIFDSGVTFWHIDHIGNYAANNQRS